MTKKRGFQIQNKHLEGHRAKKILFCMVLIMAILCVNMISAMTFDNTKDFNKSIGDYGKYYIRDWFGLLELQDVELKSNTEICYDNGCSAEKEIIMHQKGVLIDDIKFIDLENSQFLTIDYQIYIINGEKKIPYELGTEVDEGTYQAKLEGEIKSFQKLDWQIKIGGKYWTTEWASWTSNLNINLASYYDFEDDILNQVTSIILNLTENEGNPPIVSDDCLIGNCVNITDVDNNLFAPNNTLYDLFHANRSVNFWFKAHETGAGSTVLKTQADEYTLEFFTGDGSIRFLSMGTSTMSNQPIPYERWAMITASSNDTHISAYVNGTKIGSVPRTTGKASGLLSIGSNFAGDDGTIGKFDEMSWHNRSLTDGGCIIGNGCGGEIGQLYNNGTGLTYGVPNLLTNVLSEPANASLTSSTLINFTANYTSFQVTLTNATYNIWYNNGTLFNQTIIDIPATNTTTQSIGNFLTGYFKWNVRACGLNSTGSHCSWAENNWTFAYGITVTNESYPVSILEGSTGNFYINVTSIQATLTPYLIYDGTSYLGSFIQSGSDFYSSRSLDIPTVDADINKTFFWSFLMADQNVINASSHNLTVTNFAIDNCTTNSVKIMDILLKNEENNTLIDDPSSNIEIELDIYSLDNILIEEYNKQWINDSNVSVCVANLTNANYLLDMVGSFSADSFVNEFYYIDRQQINTSSIPINISLMDLKTADSTSFLFNYFDLDGLLVVDIIVHTFRKYIGEGLFREVERSKQNDDGDTIIHLVEEDVIYYFTISQNSTTIFTSNTYTALCDDIPCTIQLEEGGAFAEFSEDYDLVDNGGYSMIANSMTREVNLTFITTTPSTFNLTVYKLDDQGNKEIIGSSQTTGTSGSVSVVVPQVSGNNSFFGAVYQDGDFVKSKWVDFEEDAGLYFGNTLAIFLGILIILCLGLMAINEGSATIIFLILGMFLTMILGLIDYRTSIGVNILVYLILAGGLILWKLTKKSSR